MVKNFVKFLLIFVFIYFQFAVVAAQGIVDLKTENMDKYLSMGIACFEAQDYTGAEEWFERLVLLSPQTPMARVFLGKAQFQLNKISEAIESFQGALRLNPDDIRALMYLGEACEASARFEQAVGAYELLDMNQLNQDEKDYYDNKIVELNERINLATEKYKKAKELATDKKYSQALLEANAVEILHPRVPGINATCGEMLFLLERYPEAIMRYRLSLLLDGEKPETLLRIAMAFDALSMPVEALDHIKRWRLLSNDKSTLLEEEKRIADAAQKMEKEYIGLKPAQQMALLFQLYSWDFFQEALYWAEKIQETKLDAAGKLGLLFLKANIRKKTLELEKTIRISEEALEMVKALPQKERDEKKKLTSDFHELKGNAYWELGDKKSAKSAFEQAISTDPSNKSALIACGDLHFAINERAKGIEYLKKALATDAKDANILYRLGVEIVELQGFGSAKTYFDSFLEVESNTKRAAFIKDYMARENIANNQPVTGDNQEKKGGITFTGKDGF